MATITCRLQYLEDSDPFVSSNFPEPRRPLQYDLNEHLLLNEQIAGIHKLLEAPLKVSHLSYFMKVCVYLRRVPVNQCPRVELIILAIKATCNLRRCA